MELSDTQVALDLLNTGTEITSDSHRCFGADCSVNYFLSQQELENPASSPQPKTQDCRQQEDEDTQDHNALEKIAMHGSTDPATLPCPSALAPDKNFGAAPFHKISVPGEDSVSIPVHHPVHWWFRGEELKMLTQMECAALIDIQPTERGDSHGESEA